MTVAEIALTLRSALGSLTQGELAERAGLSINTLTKVLSGKRDFRLSTLLALADRVGLEVVLVPTGMGDALRATASHETVPSLVDTILQQRDK